MTCNLAILYGFEGSWDYIGAVVWPRRFSKCVEFVGMWEAEKCMGVACWWVASAVVLMFGVREREREREREMGMTEETEGEKGRRGRMESWNEVKSL
jgi:hypothetical protein